MTGDLNSCIYTLSMDHAAIHVSFLSHLATSILLILYKTNNNYCVLSWRLSTHQLILSPLH